MACESSLPLRWSELTYLMPLQPSKLVVAILCNSLILGWGHQLLSLVVSCQHTTTYPYRSIGAHRQFAWPMLTLCSAFTGATALTLHNLLPHTYPTFIMTFPQFCYLTVTWHRSQPYCRYPGVRRMIMECIRRNNDVKDWALGEDHVRAEVR